LSLDNSIKIFPLWCIQTDRSLSAYAAHTTSDNVCSAVNRGKSNLYHPGTDIIHLAYIIPVQCGNKCTPHAARIIPSYFWF